MSGYIITSPDPQVIRELLCGPQQHAAHVQAHRWHVYMLNINPNYLADIAARQAAKRAAGIGPEGLCPA